MPHVIIGRHAELGMLDGFLGDRTAEPRGLLIEGEPGIGKTTVFNELLAAARARDYAVLMCRPTRSEMDLSYAGLMELLTGLDEGILRSLPAPQARVLRMILREVEPDGQFDRLSLCVATAAAVRAVGAARPVLLAVDDAQWLDSPTFTTLAFVLRRLGGTATRIAVVRRSGEAADWPEELGRAIDGRVDALRLAPLGPSELSRILRRVLGWAPAWPRVVRIAELSGGNPLYAVELARAFGSTRSGEDLESALPDGVAELARSRIARLPDPVRATVELAAVPRNPTPALLDRIEPAADRAEALATAERNGILTLDGERIRFAHPILAAAAYASIPAHRRRQLHRAAATVTDDGEERARHLAAAVSEPDAEVARTLADTAEQAWRRGAPDAAADLLRLACQRTPPEDTEALALRRIAYGRLLHSAGDAPAAIAELNAVIAGLPYGPLRARALFHHMYVTRLSDSLGRGLAYGERAIDEATGDPSFQAEVYELLSRMSDNDIDRKLRLARAAAEAIEQVADPDPYVAFHARAALVEAEFYAGLGLHLELLDGLEAPPRRFPPIRSAIRAEDLLGRMLAYAGRVDEGVEMLRVMYERGLVESRPILPAMLGWMAEASLFAGRFAVAAEFTREAIERAEEVGESGGRPFEVGLHAIALARLGRLDEAEAEASRVVSQAELDPTVDFDAGPGRLALGLVRLARGEYAAAVAILHRLDEAKRAAGIREPRLWSHAAELIEALVGAGDLTEAAAVLSRLTCDAQRSGSDWSAATAARCEALVLAAQGRLDEAVEAVQRSLALFETQPMPFDRARTLLAAGQIHRRRRSKKLARQALDAALAIFVELGAAQWADRTRAELARVPQRQAAAGLTPTEEAIARLAVEGLTNREIAERAFVSPKTVEVNLTRIYRKLGVRSRAALARHLAVEHVEPGS